MTDIYWGDTPLQPVESGGEGEMGIRRPESTVRCSLESGGLLYAFEERQAGHVEDETPGGCHPPPHIVQERAALLDEAMGFAAWLAGYRVVAAHIEVDFRSMVPLESVGTIEAAVSSVSGRKITVQARLELGDASVAAESSGLFIQLSADHLEKLGGLAEKARMNPEAFA